MPQFSLARTGHFALPDPLSLIIVPRLHGTQQEAAHA